MPCTLPLKTYEVDNTGISANVVTEKSNVIMTMLAKTTNQPANQQIKNPKPQWKHHSSLLLPPNLMRLSLSI